MLLACRQLRAQTSELLTSAVRGLSPLSTSSISASSLPLRAESVSDYNDTFVSIVEQAPSLPLRYRRQQQQSALTSQPQQLSTSQPQLKQPDEAASSSHLAPSAGSENWMQVYEGQSAIAAAIRDAYESAKHDALRHGGGPVPQQPQQLTSLTHLQLPLRPADPPSIAWPSLHQSRRPRSPNGAADGLVNGLANGAAAHGLACGVEPAASNGAAAAAAAGQQHLQLDQGQIEGLYHLEQMPYQRQWQHLGEREAQAVWRPFVSRLRQVWRKRGHEFRTHDAVFALHTLAVLGTRLALQPVARTHGISFSVPPPNADGSAPQQREQQQQRQQHMHWCQQQWRQQQRWQRLGTEQREELELLDGLAECFGRGACSATTRELAVAAYSMAKQHLVGHPAAFSLYRIAYRNARSFDDPHSLAHLVRALPQLLCNKVHPGGYRMLMHRCVELLESFSPMDVSIAVAGMMPPRNWMVEEKMLGALVVHLQRHLHQYHPRQAVHVLTVAAKLEARAGSRPARPLLQPRIHPRLVTHSLGWLAPRLHLLSPDSFSSLLNVLAALRHVPCTSPDGTPVFGRNFVQATARYLDQRLQELDAVQLARVARAAGRLQLPLPPKLLHRLAERCAEAIEQQEQRHGTGSLVSDGGGGGSEGFDSSPYAVYHHEQQRRREQQQQVEFSLGRVASMAQGLAYAGVDNPRLHHALARTLSRWSPEQLDGEQQLLLRQLFVADVLIGIQRGMRGRQLGSAPAMLPRAVFDAASSAWCVRQRQNAARPSQFKREVVAALAELRVPGMVGSAVNGSLLVPLFIAAPQQQRRSGETRRKRRRGVGEEEDVSVRQDGDSCSSRSLQPLLVFADSATCYSSNMKRAPLGGTTARARIADALGMRYLSVNGHDWFAKPTFEKRVELLKRLLEQA